MTFLKSAKDKSCIKMLITESRIFSLNENQIILKYLIMEQALQFPIGQIYLIINKANNQALKLDDVSKHDKSRVSSTHPNPQDTSQLFFVERVNQDEFEITNALSGLVFDEESSEIRLKQGKGSSDQLFYLERAQIPGFHQYFWFKTEKAGKKAIKLEGILRYDKFDLNDEKQLFRLEHVNNNNIVSASTIIVNTRSGKVIDVPFASNEKGTKIIQHSKNKKFNQRWVFLRGSKGYQIRSLKNGLYLDASDSSKKPNTKIVQWENNGGDNQQFTIEKGSSPGHWVIRCVHEPSLVLGIEGDGMNDFDKLAIVNHKSEWAFEGALPN